MVQKGDTYIIFLDKIRKKEGIDVLMSWHCSFKTQFKHHGTGNEWL